MAPARWTTTSPSSAWRYERRTGVAASLLTGRVSKADADDLQAEVPRFHIGPERPVAHHFLALDQNAAQAT